MAATGLTAVKNAVVALIEANWTPDDPDSGVVNESYPDINADKFKGRKVYVLRAARADELATREDDQNDYALALFVVEKYPDAGKADEEWIDERIAWSEWLLKLVGDVRTVRLLQDPAEPFSGLWPELAELAVALDVEEIKERKLYVSQINVTYREQIAP